jgi:thiol:disulfide interchange protein DsbC
MGKLSVFLGFIVILLLANASFTENDVCSNINDKFIKDHLPLSNFKIMSKRQINDLCEVVVKTRNRLLPFYAGKNFIVSGSMYQGGYRITTQTIVRLIAENFKRHLNLLKKSVAFSYIPSGKTSLVIYMVTDPLCPYCNNAEKKVKDLADKYHVTVKTVLISVHGKEGQKKCVEAVCRDFGAEEYSSLQWKTSAVNEEYQCQKGKDLLSLAEHVSDLLMVDGVPSFYLDDGTFVDGANIDALEKAVKRLEKKGKSVKQ